jgi:hypothetical protein
MRRSKPILAQSTRWCCTINIAAIIISVAVGLLLAAFTYCGFVFLLLTGAI